MFRIILKNHFQGPLNKPSKKQWMKANPKLSVCENLLF